MSERQKTILKEVTLTGKGLHTGVNVTLTFKPAPANFGYKFQRVDLDGKPVIKAIAKNVVDTSRGTAIEENGARVNTIEHTLAAVNGLGIDNVLIEIDGPEAPILDGSSKFFVEALLSAGIIELEEEKKYFEIKKVISFVDEEKGIEICIYPDDHLSLNVLVDYNSSVLSNQYATLKKIEDFKDEIAPCRTFVFFRELELLLKHNLIKGGDLDNAIVIADREVDQSELDRVADIFNKPHIKVKQGVLNNVDLRFHNEPARHKLLDIIGDLALVGTPIKGRIIATRPGHYANTELAKKITDIIKKAKLKGEIIDVDLNQPPLLDINQIKKVLPHRYPFLLVDKIMEMTDTKVVGVKNVTMNEAFFVGHFPSEPVMPGVLQIEAMAQVGGILALSTVSDPENYSTYFLKVDQVKFKRKVIPGDTIVFKLELVTPIRRGIANMRGVGFVGENIVIEADLMAQISKTK